MIFRYIWHLFIGIALVLLIAGCRQHDDAWEAMLAFDQAYIPALALTSQQQGETAHAMMPRLQTRWEMLQLRIPADWAKPEWQRTASNITLRIRRADALIANDHFTEAHEELDGIRELLLEQRTKHHIEYVIDRFTAYHTPMEAIVLIVKGQTPATLTNEQLAAIRQLVPKAQTLWRGIEQAHIDPQRYRLTQEKTAALRESIARESAALQALQAALDSGDRQRIIQTATAIKPPFAQAFMLFGDFTVSQQK